MLTPVSVATDRAMLLSGFYCLVEGQGPDAFASEPRLLTSNYRLLLQKLEDQLRLLVGLRQHRDTGLFQHLGLGQIRRFLREVRILNGAARLGQVLAGRLKFAHRRREAVLDGAQLALEAADRRQCRIDRRYRGVRTGNR